MRRLILVLSLLLCGLSRGQSGNETIPQIQVTHTWGDLLKTGPLTVESDEVIYPDGKQIEPGKPAPVSVWVGIDRDHATSDGAALLYCVTRGVSFSYIHQNQDLGPFLVGVQKINDLPLPLSAFVFPQNSVYHDSTYLLFTQSVPLGGAGEYVIELFQAFNPDPKATPKLAAKIEVTVSGEPVLPWSPWAASKKEDLRWGSGSGIILGMTDTYTSMAVCNPVGAIAIPSASEEFIPYQEVPAPDTPLPQLIPDQPDPETQLKLEGNNLIVSVSPGVAVYYPDDHFLTRWWVNDKPFVPDPKAKDGDASTVRSLAARVWYVKEVRFELDFRPERLGAKKGDKIGVQILFCPEGWQSCGGSSQWGMPMTEAMKSANPSPPPASFSSPSNRIDFIYSGDPKNLQQK